MTAIRLAELTWPEAERVGAGGEAIGLITVGALEQHGPHLPMSIDTLHAERLADAVADRLACPVVIPPVIPVGISDAHVQFPGTLTISESTLGGFLSAYLDGLARIGIHRVAMVSGHGGNYRYLGRFAKTYMATYPESRVIADPTMDEFVGSMLVGARAAGLEPVESDAHAGVVETSIALHLAGRAWVRDFSDSPGWVTEDPEWEQDLIAQGLRAMSPNGVLGDPAGATPGAGEEIFDAVVDRFSDWICAEFSVRRAM